jgi:ectoine hydroxylase-related dioxygenase (phytanoyl-CoA dioxygenase family)
MNFLTRAIKKIAQKKLFKHNIERFGYSVMQNIFARNILKATRNVIIREFFEKKMLPSYDFVNDEFDGFDMEENNITRMPRIGNGKHNIHFDPEFSIEHKALADLVASSPVLKLLSHYMGFECSLRESGISATRPKTSEQFSKVHPDRKFGEGMQWHSDGADGEATMLLSFDGIDEDMGVLKLVPRSYMEYVSGVGYDEALVESRIIELERRASKYCYQSGNPVIFDARTMHGVENNVSDKWRVVCWFIIDCY